MSSDNFVKTEDPNFVKDTETGALISTNLSKFQQHKLKVEQAEKIKNQENDLNNIKSDISELKDEMGEIKDLLKQFLTR